MNGPDNAVTLPDVLPGVAEPDQDAAGSSRPCLRLPPKVIAERPCRPAMRDAYLQASFSSPVADFLGRRLTTFVDPELLLSPRLSHIPDPIAIPSLDRALERIVRAIVHGERIALVCDHDMDGTGSAAVLWTALTAFFGVAPDRIAVITSHRLNEGYGISEPVVERIRSFAAQLVISADNGSSDEPRIAALARGGIDVVVTDHHVLPSEGPPASAYAVVNPSRSDACYDRNVCGAGVAFLVMAKVRTALLDAGNLTEIPPLAGLLDFVAVATIADCVSLSPDASPINRVFIRRGLDRLRSGSRPCWRVFNREQHGAIDAERIAFRLAPAIAAAGRLDWAEVGFRFLIAATDEEAAVCWSELRRENQERQAIESRLRRQAFSQAAASTDPAIVLFMEDGHAGVHGITASRVVEAFGKPCAIFCAKGQGARSASSTADPELASGSFRSIHQVHVQQALQYVAVTHPGLLVAFGGHQAAAGATIRICDFDLFRSAFFAAIADQTDESFDPQPTIWTDGDLEDNFHHLRHLRAFEALGPFGRGYEAPVHSGTFVVASFRSIAQGSHGKLRLARGNLSLDAVWFDIQSALATSPVPGDTLRVAYRLTCNRFHDEETLQAIILAGMLQQPSSPLGA